MITFREFLLTEKQAIVDKKEKGEKGKKKAPDESTEVKYSDMRRKTDKELAADAEKIKT